MINKHLFPFHCGPKVLLVFKLSGLLAISFLYYVDFLHHNNYHYSYQHRYIGKHSLVIMISWCHDFQAFCHKVFYGQGT